jgi:DNA-binding NtrC family response regulator
MSSVLIVDDLVSVHEMLEAVIQPTGYTTAFATDGEKALARYKTEKFDLVLADIDMKPMDGISLLKELKAYDPSVVVVIQTAYASTESAIAALKLGAFDYLKKPFRVDELLGTLRRGLEFRAQQVRLAEAPAGGNAADLAARLPGAGPRWERVVAQVRKLATVRGPVLLAGENGSGKSDVAEVLHAAGGGAPATLIRVDGTLCSEADLRAGLLGEKGEGGEWVRQARGGTLLLQHIERLSLPIQHEFVSVLRQNAHGFRLIAATTQDLEAMVDAGKFHEELFFRVAALPVNLPPLRQRPEDLPLLIRHICAGVANPHFEGRLVEFTPDALAVLSAYPWPGNLTELRAVVSRIVTESETRVVTSQQLPLRVHEVTHWPSLAEYLAGQERQYLDQVLHATRGDRAAAARVLGIDVSRFG